jgi:DNA-directed RNA polymerase subunit RPC12/RpoP
MKCPNPECSHQFKADEFGMPDNTLCVVCPDCESKIMARFEMGQESENDTPAPFIWELEIV